MIFFALSKKVLIFLYSVELTIRNGMRVTCVAHVYLMRPSRPIPFYPIKITVVLAHKVTSWLNLTFYRPITEIFHVWHLFLLYKETLQRFICVAHSFLMFALNHIDSFSVDIGPRECL